MVLGWVKSKWTKPAQGKLTAQENLINFPGSIMSLPRRKWNLISLIEVMFSSCSRGMESTVIGIPDDDWGEIVKAVIMLKPGQ
jgi:hypothetical protein